MAASLEQSTRRGKSLEEEGRRVTQERDDALLLLKELRGEEEEERGLKELPKEGRWCC